MQKSALVGIVLFVVGVVVGRTTALMGSSSSTPPPPAEVSRPLVPQAPSGPMAPVGTGSTPANGGSLTGKVAEVLQVSQYTYLRFESGEWAAIEAQPSLAAGAEVTLDLQNQMENFTSPSLGRTFEKIWFATMRGAGPSNRPLPPAMPSAMPTAPSEPQAAAPANPAVKGALDAVKGAGGLTMRVVDVYTERQLLNGRAVKVAGKVDRVNAVQGVNYVHLKDGSGVAADKTDDLLCISSEPVTAGQQVVMEGVVAVDKNVGMGINPVVIDQAHVAK